MELASGMEPVNFTVNFDLGAAYTLSTVDIVLTAHAYVDPLPSISLVTAPMVMPGSTLIAHTTAYVINDEDSGYFGYWAIDNYSLTNWLWQEPNGTFFFITSFIGTSTTYSGIISPGSSSTEAGYAVAMFSGYISGWFTGKLISSPTVPTSGFIGVYNFGGSPGNLTTPTSPAILPPYVIDWNGLYVTSPSYTTTPFALAYFYQTQVWVDANYVPQADSGNILVT